MQRICFLAKNAVLFIIQGDGPLYLKKNAVE